MKETDNEDLLQDNNIADNNENIIEAPKARNTKASKAEEKEERERENLNIAYASQFEKKQSDIAETYAAQKNNYDKFMYLVTLSAMDHLITGGGTNTIDVKTLKKNHMPGNHSVDTPEIYTEAFKELMTEILSEGNAVQYEELHRVYGLIVAKMYYDIGSYYKKMYDLLPPEADDEMRKSKAMYLTLGSNCKGLQLYYSFIENLGPVFKHSLSVPAT